MVTVVSFLAVISSEIEVEVLEEELNLPIYNSVLLVANKTLGSCVNDDSGDSCNFSSQEIVLEETTASGMAISTIDGKTYILTADHFCENFMGQLFPGVSRSMWAVDINGNMWRTNVVYQERSTDLCLIESNMDHVEHVEISQHDPQVGETVYAIASPRGIGGKNISLHFEGKFSGCDITGNCFFTIPSTFGSSGGIILNSDNQMVGMIQMKPANFDSVSIGTRRENMIYFLLSFREDTGINLLYSQ
jgi:S1-C subfamily serine protease